MPVIQIRCHGRPYDIGKTHGIEARHLVKGSISFYESFFTSTARLAWPDVETEAKKFLPYLTSAWPQYVEEMKGVADGAQVNFESILALNVRTEIAYGLAADGCTAFAWKTNDATFIGQNWDWEAEQADNIISLHIEQDGKPAIHMMTEAGIIGKIGLNAQGVGVTLNAIRAKGVDFNKLPTHLALRTVLDSESQRSGRDVLLRSGVAAASHITICDASSGAVGLECTSRDIVELEMQDGICAHTNHLIHPHAVQDLKMLADSPFRLKRVTELLKETSPRPTMDSLREILKDEENYPAAICRSPKSDSGIETLFSIVMNLGEKYAKVKMGRPTEDGEELELRPDVSAK